MNKVYCCYPGGKHKALTMSYDDGRTQDRRLIGIFNENGIRGTFHLNSGRLEEENRIHPDEIAELYRGHEIACHTVTHPTIARCPLPEAAAEVLEDRKALERITGTPVRGMSYPNRMKSSACFRAAEFAIPGSPEIPTPLRCPRIPIAGKRPATTTIICWSWETSFWICSKSSTCT